MIQIFIIKFRKSSRVTMLRLTGWLQQHAPPQQLVQDFRASRSEDGGHRWNGALSNRLDETAARPEKADSSSTSSSAESSPKLLLRSVSEAKGGNQWRTEEDAPPPELAVCCVCRTHTCQQKLVLPRAKEIRK